MIANMINILHKVFFADQNVNSKAIEQQRLELPGGQHTVGFKSQL